VKQGGPWKDTVHTRAPRQEQSSSFFHHYRYSILCFIRVHCPTVHVQRRAVLFYLICDHHIRSRAFYITLAVSLPFIRISYCTGTLFVSLPLIRVSYCTRIVLSTLFTRPWL